MAALELRRKENGLARSNHPVYILYSLMGKLQGSRFEIILVLSKQKDAGQPWTSSNALLTPGEFICRRTMYIQLSPS